MHDRKTYRSHEHVAVTAHWASRFSGSQHDHGPDMVLRDPKWQNHGLHMVLQDPKWRIPS